MKVFINFNTYNTLQVNKQLNRALLFFGLLLVLFLSAIGISYFLGNSIVSSNDNRLSEKKPPLSFSKVIDSSKQIKDCGPFTCKVLTPSPALLGIEEEVEVQGLSIRPDQNNQSAKLLLRHSKMTKEVAVSTPFYLKFESLNENEHQLVFSDQPTAIEAKVILATPSTLQMIVSWMTPFNNKAEGIVFNLRAPVRPEPEGQKDKMALHALTKGVYRGKDIFLGMLGGEEYASLASMAMVDFSLKTESEPYYLKEGDYLVWEDNTWMKTDLSESKGKPTARVKTISSHDICLQYWDTTGYYHNEVIIRISSPTPFTIVPERLILEPKLRSSKRISCLFEGKRAFLNEGEWILHVDGEWKIMRSASLIQDFLDHRLKGVLIVIDKISLSTTDAFLEGMAFNEARTQVKPFKIPILRSPRKEPSSPKRKKFEERMNQNLTNKNYTKDSL